MPAETVPARYVVAGTKPWNRLHFESVLRLTPGDWHFASTPAELASKLGTPARYVFFLHWSDRVPEETILAHECVCFHMTDVPYGRGGSPLQNLIVRGHSLTKLTALRMTTEFDAGPVYLKEDLGLGGGAEEIYIRSSRLSAAMILRIINEKILPIPQTGVPVLFKRRTLAQSELPSDLPTLGEVHDFIRMLDAEGYPRAYHRIGKFLLRFSRAVLYDGLVSADVTITLCEDDA